MITAALEGKLDDVEYESHPVFGMMMPKSCQGVPPEILNPKNTWTHKTSYDEKAKKLAAKFVENFKKFKDHASDEILAAAPVIR
jgi:phosphoenolpyruvate carboxykinase (ATP)